MAIDCQSWKWLATNKLFTAYCLVCKGLKLLGALTVAEVRIAKLAAATAVLASHISDTPLR